MFRAGGRSFSPADVVRAAEDRSALGPVRLAIRAALACEQYAGEEGFALDPDDLESAANQYRADHDLTTAEDTERWLDDHELTLDEFSSWLERGHWRKRFENDLAVITRDCSPAAGDIDALVWPEVVFGGHLAGLARDLAARVAARLASDEGATQPAWADDTAEMERLFRERCRKAVAPGHVDRELAARAPSLIKLDVQLASFASAGAAREAWLCVTEDGEPLDEVSRRAGAELQQVRLFLDELPEPLRQPAQSAVPGDILPPLDIGDQAVVCRVSAKDRPTTRDVEVLRRIESALVDRAIDDLIRDHIRWE
jgi:hypothetical protein